MVTFNWGWTQIGTDDSIAAGWCIGVLHIESDHVDRGPREFSVQIWPILTRLGEVQILLPVAAITSIALFLRVQTRGLARAWALLIGGATAITTATKLAFIGWGLGWAAINFTGVSGHTMFATAIFPILALTLDRAGTPRSQRIAFGLGLAIAAVVGVSRIEVGAHSLSEVIAGWLLGGAVSAMTLAISKRKDVFVHPLLSMLFIAWIAATPSQLQASNTHSLVTRLALAVSGHEKPFQRHDLMGDVSH